MDSVLTSIKSDETSRVTERLFRDLATEFCFVARKLGYFIVPTYKDFKDFDALPTPDQRKILQSFELFYETLMASRAKGANLSENLSIVWWVIKDLKLLPPGDLFGHLEEADYFEIYNPDHIQIFRSLNFYDLTSYSIEDTFTNSWSDLYSRPEPITQEMIKTTSQIMAGDIKSIVRTNYPVHMVTDRFSPGKEWSLIQHKLFAPLRSSDGGIYLFNSFKVIDRKMRNDDEFINFE